MASDEIILFSQDNFFELTTEAKSFFTQYGFDGSTFDTLLSDEDSRRYSQIAGVFNLNGETSLKSISPEVRVLIAHKPYVIRNFFFSKSKNTLSKPTEKCTVD